jgi:ubiquinone/menaquinone biosynthesis C-methylase UbiE
MTQPLAPSSGLHSVDQQNDLSVRLRFLDAERAKPAMQQANEASVDALRLHPGSHVLDVGCGAGDDARRLVEVVGKTGHVEAIDIDPKMIAEAVRRSANDVRRVSFRVLDVYELDYDAGRFDGCRAERTFLHLADPGRALAQMVRVVRPGGRVVVLDRDIETRTIDAADRAVTRRIINFWCDSFLGGWVGRSLPRLFREAGLDEISVEPFTVVDTDYAAFNAQYDLPRIAARAQAAGVIRADEAERWLAALLERDRAGSFFTSMTSFVVAGRKPAKA